MILRLMLFVTISLFLIATCVEGQRPPYAGSRPSGYKDRFRPRPTGASGTVLNDIDNRFGEQANNLDNNSNVTQRPPVGVEIVYGEPSNVNDQQSTVANDTEQQQQDVLAIVDRLGVQVDDQQSQQRPTTSPGIDQVNTENSSNDLFTGGSRPISSRPTVVPIRQTTSGHVPYDAHGDVFLVNLLNQRPVDQQPFWFVNYQAIEAHRNG